ncbi:MAG: 16S rRNA (guanine527-N7)-methyltransferase [Pseudohongiellaceae bacterium]|jgi:16S rRNA (guanine527-N7)-methyltransferase
MPETFQDVITSLLLEHLPRMPGLSDRPDAPSPGMPSIEDLARDLTRFCVALAAANEHINLTGIVDPEGMAVRHVLDALTALPALSEEGMLVDLGSGCGVPGIPLAMALPHRQVVLVESRERKAAALSALVEELELSPRVTAVRARGEHWLAKNPADEVVTRAVGSCADQLKFLRKARHNFKNLVMLKGPAGDNELAEAFDRLPALGFDPPKRYSAELPAGAGTRVLLAFRPAG